MRLIDHVRERHADSPLWSAGGVEIRSGQLEAYLDQIDPEPFRGQGVAVSCSDNRNLALALSALDGVASRLLLLPAHISDEDARSFAGLAGCDLLAGDGTLPASWAGIAESPTGTANTENLVRDQDTRWIIPTSGTTGVPKLVAHSLETLTRTVKTDKALGNTLRWGLLYDLTRFAGLQVFLQALCGGSCLVIPENTDNLGRTITELSSGQCNALSATPSMWRKLLMTGPIEELPLRIISLGGEISDQGILNTLRSRFSAARITHIYASTEAGVGFSVTDGRSGFPAAFLESPPPGIELRTDAEGFLHLRPAKSDQQYLGREEAISDSQGWINTGDLVERRDDRLLFLGRANGSINVGGRKVQPHEVEEVILGVEGVAFASVSGRKNPILGSLVEARVVPRPGADAARLKEAIKAACIDRLEDFKRPAVIRITDDIALNSAGKVLR